jgi:hypothetical protein
MTKVKPLVPLARQAEEIGIKPQSAYYAARQGYFGDALVKIGRKVFVDPDRFEEWRRRGGSPLEKPYGDR